MILKMLSMRRETQIATPKNRNRRSRFAFQMSSVVQLIMRWAFHENCLCFLANDRRIIQFEKTNKKKALEDGGERRRGRKEREGLFRKGIIHHLKKRRFLPVRKIMLSSQNTIIIITHYYMPVVSHVSLEGVVIVLFLVLYFNFLKWKRKFYFRIIIDMHDLEILTCDLSGRSFFVGWWVTGRHFCLSSRFFRYLSRIFAMASLLSSIKFFLFLSTSKHLCSHLRLSFG